VQEPADLAERVRLRRLLLEPADEDHVTHKLAREVGVDPEPRRRLLSHHLGHAPTPCPLLYIHHRLASHGGAPAPRRAAARTTSSITGSPPTAGPPPRDVLRLALPAPLQARLARRGPRPATCCGSHHPPTYRLASP